MCCVRARAYRGKTTQLEALWSQNIKQNDRSPERSTSNVPWIAADECLVGTTSDTTRRPGRSAVDDLGYSVDVVVSRIITVQSGPSSHFESELLQRFEWSSCGRTI